MPRLLQITDTHLYGDAAARFDGVDTRASLARVLAHVRAHAGACDALLLTGDLAMDGSRAAYVRLAAELQALDMPIVTLPGNHDEPGELAVAAPALWTPMPRCLTLDGWRVLCLDTRVPGSAHGEVDAAQCAWLARTLPGAGDGHAVIFMHHPPVAIGSPWMDAMGLREAARFWSALAGKCVRLIACGHVHQDYAGRRGGVCVVTTPSTCVQFMPGATRYTRDAAAPGYRVIELAGDGRFTTSVVRVPAAPLPQSTAPRR